MAEDLDVDAGISIKMTRNMKEDRRRANRKPFITYDEWMAGEATTPYDYLGIPDGAPLEEAEKAVRDILAKFKAELRQAYVAVKTQAAKGKKTPTTVTSDEAKKTAGHAPPIPTVSEVQKENQRLQTSCGRVAAAGAVVPPFTTPKKPTVGGSARQQDTKDSTKFTRDLGELNPTSYGELILGVKSQLNSDDSDSGEASVDEDGEETGCTQNTLDEIWNLVREKPKQVATVKIKTEPRVDNAKATDAEMNEERESSRCLPPTVSPNVPSDSRSSLISARGPFGVEKKLPAPPRPPVSRNDSPTIKKKRRYNDDDVTAGSRETDDDHTSVGPRPNRVSNPTAEDLRQMSRAKKKETDPASAAAPASTAGSSSVSKSRPFGPPSRSVPRNSRSSLTPARGTFGVEKMLSPSPRPAVSRNDASTMKRRRYDDDDVTAGWRETDDDHRVRATGSTNEPPGMEFNNYPRDRFFECPHEAPVRMTAKEERRFNWVTGNSTNSGKADDFVDLGSMDTQVVNPFRNERDDDDDDETGEPGFDRTKFLQGNAAWEATRKKCEKRDALRLKKMAWSLMGYRAVLGKSYVPPVVLLKSKDLLKADSHIVDSNKGFTFGRAHSKVKAVGTNRHNPIHISMEHFRITVPTIGTVTLTDLSSNGTFYKRDNGEKIQVPARPGSITLPLRQPHNPGQSGVDTLSIFAGDYEFTVEAVWFEKAAATEMAERSFISLLNEKADITQNVLRESDIGREIGRWLRDTHLPHQESAQKVMTRLKTKCQQTLKK